MSGKENVGIKSCRQSTREFEVSRLPRIGKEDDGQLRLEKANDECFKALPRAAMKR